MKRQRRRKHKYARALRAFFYHWHHNKVIALAIHLRAIERFPALHGDPPFPCCAACEFILRWIGVPDLFTARADS